MDMVMKEQDTYEEFEELLRELRESFELSVAEEIKEVEGTSNRYLVFLLGEEAFGVPIWQLQEALLDKRVTPVPGSPPSIHGVINYRNRLLSVSNIHNMLQLPFKETDNACLLVTREIKSKPAVLADGLVDLISVNQADIKPKVSGQKESVDQLIAGEIYHGRRLITLIDLNKVV